MSDRFKANWLLRPKLRRASGYLLRCGFGHEGADQVLARCFKQLAMDFRNMLHALVYGLGKVPSMSVSGLIYDRNGCRRA
jgi:hypothetical protein